jgi:uncharacterized membrane protein YjjB (DUF3815 family)
MATYAAVFCTQFFSIYTGKIVSALIGSLLVGLLGNIFSRISNHPSIVVTTSAILMLVPGSFSLYSIHALISNDVHTSMNLLFSMFMVAMALSLGLMAANVILPTKKKLAL